MFLRGRMLRGGLRSFCLGKALYVHYCIYAAESHLVQRICKYFVIYLKTSCAGLFLVINTVTEGHESLHRISV